MLIINNLYPYFFDGNYSRCIFQSTFNINFLYMTQTKKRKGPQESATKFSVGTKKKGNDGNMWLIVADKNGTHRWKKLSGKTQKNR